MKRRLLVCVLSLALASCGGGGASSNNSGQEDVTTSYDGNWLGRATSSINYSSKGLQCKGADIAVTISNGQLSGTFASDWGITVTASGSCSASGSISNGTFSGDSHNGTFTGSLLGNSGSGNWSDNNGCYGTFSLTNTLKDTTAPSNTTTANFINSGASSTSSTSVILSIAATDVVGVTAYYTSENSSTPSATESGWKAITSTTSYTADVSFPLSSGDGTKAVYVWFKDAEGNVSGSVNDSIILSTQWSLLKLPDTGQIGEYTATFGEDSDYTINSPSYTDNGDATITDTVTGLIWQKEDDNTTRTWADAGTYCDSLTLGGYSDWRRPSKKELISIVNYGTYSPSINTTYFPNTNPSGYWSTEPWYVSFDSGYASNSWTYDNYVRCCRNERQTTTKSLTDNGNGTVTDKDTTLIWQQGEGVSMVWESALAYCEDLSLAGNTDWRLPNVKELESITDDTKYNPAINTTYFPNTNSSSYWSSTTLAAYSSIALGVHFYYGIVHDYFKSSDYDVRCVRGGQ